MKYTVNGFLQEKLIEYELDDKDAILLRYFVDFKGSGKMKSRIVDEEQYYWLSYKGVIEEYPILNLKEDSVYRRLKKLCEKKILVSITVREGGTYSFYNIGENYITLISDTNPNALKKDNISKNPQNKPKKNTINQSENNPKQLEENPSNGEQNPTNSDLNPEQNIHLLYPSTKSNLKDIYSRVIDELNTKANSKFRASNKKTQKLISARIKDGYCLEDFFMVISNMSKKWLNDPKMQDYLRPETLFGDKFESYLNIKTTALSKANQHDSKKGKLRFDNFKGRDYDYDDLERKLLGWDS
ncbi:conserved phage C-terminal domain-containing protein [Clostridium intestinale]|uniref:Conserved phage C-terminal domain-containing protein n=1 Tax=Clostridium intestinale TaxID=36845 RepID=A0A7D6ZV96_9CLOT|nr:conserved phage C-terminal domain-containing protein [Clostridium intestinale]QLY78062.1 conserved phage C-terminal domain-containing protein [Clostridium intestinale]